MKLPVSRAKPYLPVVAMGDIAFLLLVFFLVTSALDQSRRLQIEIPSAKNVIKIPQDEVFTVFMDREGNIFYKGKERSLFELQFLYLKHASIFRKPVIQIIADKDLDYVKVNDIIQALRRNLPVKVAFSCREEKEE